jgi:uncharacterized protein YcgL (UPF0745 family)
MDKVKDFLRSAVVYQFWILLALTLVLPIWGWWSTTNDLVAQTKAQTTKIDQAFGSLPKSGEKNPNENWIDEVKKSNEKLDSGLREAWQYLYQRQQQFKVWPKELIDRGFTDPDKATDFDLQRYNILYPKEVDTVWKIVNTVDGKSLELSGPVIFPKERMPRASWANGLLSPTAEQMKGAQEDLWLAASLLRSIQRVNGNAKSTLKAAVREIQDLRLRGGSLAAAAAAPAADPGGGMGGMGGRRGEDMGGGGGAPAPAAADMQAGFDPGEEMGADTERGGPPRGGDGDGPRGGMGGGAPAAPPKRYLEELPQARKRGFYLQVVIDQSKLPELLAQLSNSEWPVRILHVNMAERNPDSLVPPGDDNLPPAARIAAARGGAGDGVGFGGRPGMEFPMRGPGLNPGGLPGVPAPAADEGRAAAMADPYLAVVAVSGYIVIYNPPPVTEVPAAEPTAAAPAPPGNGAVPAVVGKPAAPAAGKSASPPSAINGTGIPPASSTPVPNSKAGAPPKSSAPAVTTTPSPKPNVPEKGPPAALPTPSGATPAPPKAGAVPPKK